MKFIKPLLMSAFICALLSACSSNPEKVVEKSPIEKTADAEVLTRTTPEVGAAGPTVTQPAISSNVLPVGPVMPNPYLQSTQKFSEQVEVNFRAAVASMQQKNWDHAEATLNQLAEKNPKLSGVHLNLGIVYRNKGDNEKAAAEFNRAISANMKNVDAYNLLAVLKREAGDFSGAENFYQKALRIWPFYPDAHKNIAILYDLYLGKPEQALPHYQAYQQLLPAPDKQVESWVADLQRRLNTGKAAEKTQEAK